MELRRDLAAAGDARGQNASDAGLRTPPLPSPPSDYRPLLHHGLNTRTDLSLRVQRPSLVQAKFGVLDMEDKQRLFRLIRRLTGEDSGKSMSSAAQPDEKRRASAVRPAAEVSSHGSVTPTLLDKELLENNNLLDLDELDGSGDLLSAVSPMRRQLPADVLHALLQHSSIIL